MKIPFSFAAEQYSIVCMCHIFIMHSSGEGHLDNLHFLAIVDRAAKDVAVRVFVE